MNRRGHCVVRRVGVRHPAAILVVMAGFLGIVWDMAFMAKNKDASRGVSRVQPHNDTSHNVENPAEVPWPRIAWLMSFPHSGTTYTLEITRQLSLKYTAGNSRSRKKRHKSKSGLVKVYKNLTGGPYWTRDSNPHKYEYPSTFEYVLTKTHCGAYCVICRPSWYIVDPAQFLDQCRGGQVAGMRPDEVNNFIYPPEFVKRAVHLIRSPFDNIVSRFHYVGEKGKRELGITWTNATSESFTKYCEALDTKYVEREKTTFSDMIDPDLWKMLLTIPCHAEFFRYVQWHNLAFLVTDSILGIPRHVLHYERFGSDFNETASELLHFLSFKLKGVNHTEFIKGKEYANHFSPEEREAIKVAVQAMSSPTTWRYIRHYFACI